jgi:hypothetical protein
MFCFLLRDCCKKEGDGVLTHQRAASGARSGGDFAVSRGRKSIGMKGDRETSDGFWGYFKGYALFPLKGLL